MEHRTIPGQENWGTRLEARHRIFVAVVMGAATAVGLLLPEPDRATQLVVLAVGVVLLALPHGAVHPGWRSPRGLPIGSAPVAGLYLALAALAVAAWVAAPMASLAVFLVAPPGTSVRESATPNAHDPVAVGRVGERGRDAVAPLLLRTQETLDLLGLLCGQDLSSLPKNAAWSALMAGWALCRVVSWLDRLGVAQRTGDGISLAIVAGQIGCVASFLALPCPGVRSLPARTTRCGMRSEWRSDSRPDRDAWRSQVRFPVPALRDGRPRGRGRVRRAGRVWRGRAGQARLRRLAAHPAHVTINPFAHRT